MSAPTSHETPIGDLDWRRVPGAAFVVDRRLLARNAAILGEVRRAAGVKVLLALKGFAMWSTFDVFRAELDGCAASGPIEARLAREEFDGGRGKEVHTYAPAFSDEDLRETLLLSDHVIFNSVSEVERHAAEVARVRAAGKEVAVGLRVNPEYSEIETALYDPCARGSRLGTRPAALSDAFFERGLVDGLHVHALCEQGADVLARVLARVEATFGKWFPRLRWLNLGGGHWITKPDYDRALLVETLRGLRSRFPHLEVILEPGEAAVTDTGVLVATVLDVVDGGELPVAVLDVSATAHMPDVLEMPYRPVIHGAGEPFATPHTYRLGGPTCLAGDVIGDWSFAEPLRRGDRVVFADMSQYTMVKTTMFNGVKHPKLMTWDGEELVTVRSFGYADFRGRLS